MGNIMQITVLPNMKTSIQLCSYVNVPFPGETIANTAKMLIGTTILKK